MKLKIAMALVSLAGFGIPVASAQTCMSLSGIWRFDPAASLLGSGLSFDPTYAVKAITLTLAQSADGSVSQRWAMTGPHLDEVDSFSVRPDGMLRPTHLTSLLDTTPQAVKGRWVNCTLTVQAQTHLFGQELWTESRFLMEPNGRRLTVVQTSHSDLGDVERRLVFQKAGG